MNNSKSDDAVLLMRGIKEILSGTYVSKNGRIFVPKKESPKNEIPVSQRCELYGNLNNRNCFDC